MRMRIKNQVLNNDSSGHHNSSIQKSLHSMEDVVSDKDKEKIEKGRNRVHGYDHQSFPFIRPEKEELFSQTGYNKGGFQIH